MYVEMFVQATHREDIVTCLQIGDYRRTHQHVIKHSKSCKDILAVRNILTDCTKKRYFSTSNMTQRLKVYFEVS
jgi:hypothetical protein